MPYDEQVWEDSPSTNTPISAAALNHMEAGIGAASVEAETAVSGSTAGTPAPLVLWTGTPEEYATIATPDPATVYAVWSDVPPFTPILEENTPVTDKAVPVGTSGCWVSLIGGGGGGGKGDFGESAGSGEFSGGGGGGGGGGTILRGFIPVASLGTTYSVALGAPGLPAGAGTASTFTSGSVAVTADGGGPGGTVTAQNQVGTPGVGGAATATGVALTGVTGGDGGSGATMTAPGGPGASQTAGAAGGGAGGNMYNTALAKPGEPRPGEPLAGGVSFGGAGGQGQGGTPGLGGYDGQASPTGGAATDSPIGIGGSGGGGGAGGQAATPPTSGGNGGDGGGGGGGSGGNYYGDLIDGGAGGAGYTLIEWV